MVMQVEERQSAEKILQAWRAAERELALRSEGSPEYDAACAEVHALARMYQDAVRSVGESPRDTTVDDGPQMTPQPSQAGA
jgi:hypothetical protein